MSTTIQSTSSLWRQRLLLTGIAWFGLLADPSDAAQGGPLGAPPTSCGRDFVVLLTNGLGGMARLAATKPRASATCAGSSATCAGPARPSAGGRASGPSKPPAA